MLANRAARMQPVPLIRLWIRARRGSTAFLHTRLEDNLMGQSPERTIRLGHVSAGIFVQTTGANGQTRQFRTVNVQRSYKDGDKKKYVSNFTVSDLPAAIRCLQLAQEHIEAQEMATPEMATPEEF